MDKQLLEVRLSIVMRRENYNFLEKFTTFQTKLKKYFNYEYTLDEIENALHKMEERYIIQETNPDEVKNIIDIPEDYKY